MGNIEFSQGKEVDIGFWVTFVYILFNYIKVLQCYVNCYSFVSILRHRAALKVLQLKKSYICEIYMNLLHLWFLCSYP